MTVLALPTTKEEVERLIRAQVQESLYLDYKQSKAIADNKRAEIAKDVSAFANSDGGLIIYGVIEDKEKRLPVEIDEGITDSSKFSREWLENVITSSVAPKLEGVEISQIRIADERSIFAVKVAKSFRGPHQERLESKAYYRRRNFKSEPMEDYEITEARSRRRIVPPLINVELKIKNFVTFVISNSGDMSAQDVRFNFSEGMSWHKDTGSPRVLRDGIKTFPAGRTFTFLYNSYIELLKEESETSKQFEIGVSYLHPELGQQLTEHFSFDLLDFKETIDNKTDVEIMTKELAKELRTLVGEVRKMEKRLEPLSNIASTTGLDLSVETIENLRHIANQDGQIEKLNPVYCSAQVFTEILKVSRDVAWHFANYFSGYGEAQSITQIEGVTEEILERFKRYFMWVEVRSHLPTNSLASL